MTKQFACTLLLLIAATGAYAAGIEGGVPTTIEEHPYVARVQRADGTSICSGALINEDTVVTAATCLEFYDISQFVVSLNNGAKIVKIAKSSYDSAFDFVTMENDIGILKLAEPVKGTYIPLADKDPATGATGVVTGWNANNELVDIPETFIDTKDCVSGEYRYTDDDVFPSMVCGIAKGCNAQAGSPFVVKNELVGLVSWGYGCANKANPTVFTNVPALKLWVEKMSASL
ncbi:trypsin theta-like [Rhagoletis pomonella]|uniref:trypsin theta-like n=1 Tax=Rhagoletis pomonella TaxID=28610 RepID=UPI00177B318B|nr:trypsin theta-like [Rhagoletis pomonella]